MDPAYWISLRADRIGVTHKLGARFIVVELP